MRGLVVPPNEPGHATPPMELWPLTDIAALAIGESERGIGIQTAVLSEDHVSFLGSTVYLDIAEARGVIRKLREAIAAHAERTKEVGA